MRSLRSTLSASRDDENGIGIVEVLVAFLVFAVIAVGMAASMATMTRITADSDNRETAAHLAAAEIDRVQSIADAFDLHSNYTGSNPYAGSNPAPYVTVNGVRFTIATTVVWQSADGSSGSCGSGGSSGVNLQYKRINVRVTWPNMFLKQPVRADSVLAPSTRINDPSYGTILVSVYGSDGTGRSGVTVTATPTSGGAAISTTIDPTDSDGCSYILKVVPGSYRIAVTRANYVDSFQIPAPYVDRVVTAGSSATAQFQYDQQATFSLQYASNAVAPVVPVLPGSLLTTYFSGANTFPSTTTTSPVKLHPFSSGYSATAGKLAGCLDTDPVNWPASSTRYAGARVPTIPAVAGGPSTTLQIPMGLAAVKAPAAGQIYAEQQTGSVGGSPGCTAPTIYTFTTGVANGSTTNIALPYGTWKLSIKNGATYTPITTITVLSVGSVTGSVLTVDPRLVKP